ncbi:MAG: Crp/Fnr family transcriptional regulator [Bacteroidetes bacterium]|nr:Crp/Fnr family transcriptional regulator [Bacteroidota bacterium]
MATNTKFWYLENFILFNCLSKDEMGDLAQKVTMRNCSKDKFIYFPDEPSRNIYFLKEGRVKIGSYSEDGKEIIKTILQPGEIFGELSITGEEKRNDFAQALDDNVMICVMNIKDMEELMEKNTKLGMRLTKLIGFRLRKVERRLESLIFKDARTRIVDLIKDMATEDSKMVGTETLIMNNLTHQDMAKLTATSRQTVTTVLNELREKNLIYFDRKRILIRDIDKLK